MPASSGQINVRGLDPGVWRDIRAEAVRRGITTAQFIESLWDEHLRGPGALFADELVRTGHRPWMHGADGAQCWCRESRPEPKRRQVEVGGKR